MVPVAVEAASALRDGGMVPLSPTLAVLGSPRVEECR